MEKILEIEEGRSCNFKASALSPIQYNRLFKGRDFLRDMEAMAEKAQEMARASLNPIQTDGGEVIHEINVGIDFGGNGSGHAFVATGMTEGYQKLIVLRTKRYVEGERDPDTGRRLDDIDPDVLSALFLKFFKGIMKDYGFITKIYADSAEQVLIRGIRNALNKANYGSTKVENARKSEIIGRIRTVTSKEILPGAVVVLPAD